MGPLKSLIVVSWSVSESSCAPVCHNQTPGGARHLLVCLCAGRTQLTRILQKPFKGLNPLHLQDCDKRRVREKHLGFLMNPSVTFCFPLIRVNLCLLLTHRGHFKNKKDHSKQRIRASEKSPNILQI